ncbi:endonuclease/exonuclease/phosphatase family protein [Sagittula sp. S175]|uniref:endonuclease/exonuclease/phosphatase family protein n=1 Tax=Sagittula sp. S175 TaxID=3415129 RepID=UPI003C7C34A8
MVAFAARADGLRVATWHGDFSRKGPGLLLRELVAGDVDLTPIISADPDILVLTDIDYDGGLAALGAMQKGLRERGADLRHAFAVRPNTGWQTGLDLDGDGRTGGPRDAQGYGLFSGQGGVAVLSRYPVAMEADFSRLPWGEAPDSNMMSGDTGQDVQRLSSAAHWALRVDGADGPFLLLTLAATPPVFDGPEDRNGRRNHDEVLLWGHYLDGRLGAPPGLPVVIAGNLNLDPERGEGLHEAVQTLLAHPRLTDPQPGVETVSWDSTGPMRVSYVLPDKAFDVLGAGVMPSEGDSDPGRHRLVWVDLSLRPAARLPAQSPPSPGSG